MNRRQSKVSRNARMLALRLLRMRRAVLLVVPYLLLLGWLFSGSRIADLRAEEIYGVREVPQWTAPDGVHRFGTAANGADLFELSRLAMANSVSFAVVSALAGIALALLVAALSAFERRETGFGWLGRLCRAGTALPSVVLLMVLAGSADRGLLPVFLGLVLVLALHLAPVLARWCREEEDRFDVVAACAAGLPRRQVLLGRVLPSVLLRMPGVFAQCVPMVVLVEMALSFLGFTGARLSVGTMVAFGQAYLIEAPWMTVYPGLLATAVVMALSLLGWQVAATLRSGQLPPVL